MSRRLSAGFAGACGSICLVLPHSVSAQTEISPAPLNLKPAATEKTYDADLNNGNYGRWEVKRSGQTSGFSLLNPPQTALGNIPADINPVITLRSRDYKLGKDVKFSMQFEGQKKGSGGWFEEAISSKSIPFATEGEGKWSMKGIKKGASVTLKYEF